MVRLSIGVDQRRVAFGGQLFQRTAARGWQFRPFAFLWVLASNSGKAVRPGVVVDKIDERFSRQLALGVKDVARVRNVIVEAIKMCAISDEKKQEFYAVLKTVPREGTLLELQQSEVEIVKDFDPEMLGRTSSAALQGVIDLVVEMRCDDARAATDLFVEVRQLPEKLVGRAIPLPWELLTEAGAHFVLEVHPPLAMAAVKHGGMLGLTHHDAVFRDLTTPVLEEGLAVIARNVTTQQCDELVRLFKRFIAAERLTLGGREKL